ncbi:MAG: peptidylprolyl isomerase [Xanthomonadaceae bacterium]|nr:peptidylprolyl isomerase [Xanthomonadaceae bacterium]
MQKKPKVVSFHYTLRNTAGEVLDSSMQQGPLTFMEGVGQIIPGLESKLLLMIDGQKATVKVAAIDAYGEKDPGMLVQVPKEKIPGSEKVKAGDQFRAGPSEDHTSIFTVIKVTDTEIHMDGNHPLAGQDLEFDVEITKVRDASDEELAHGHVHGPGGHHH